MAINWMDNFNIYGTDAGNAARMLNGVYAETVRVNLIADPDPTATGLVVQKYSGGLGGDFRKVLPVARTTVGIAQRNWLTALPNGGDPHRPSFMVFKDTNNVDHIAITVDPSGNILVLRIDSGPTLVVLGQTATPVLVANAWQHMETKVFFDNVAGTVQVKIEGIQVINISGVRTVSNVVGALVSCQNVASRSGQDGPNLNIKDLIVWDNTGTFNNDFMGSCQVLKLSPVADVGARNWNTQQSTTPAANVPTTSTVGGTLAAATYYYKVAAIYQNTGESLPSAEVSIATTGATSSNTITWTAPLGSAAITGYKIYRGTAAGAENVYYTVGNVLTFTDTGAAATAGTPVAADNGAGYAEINEVTPDDDNTYIAAPFPAPSPYKCSLSQLPATVTSVRGVMPIHRSRKTDGGDGNIQIGFISGATTGLGSNRAITTAYTYWWDIYDADPNGSIAWSRVSANAMNLQFNRTL